MSRRRGWCVVRHRWSHISAILFLIFLGSLLMTSCGGDDDTPTDPVDTVAPTVVSVDPAPNSTGVSRSSKLSVVFSEAPAAATIKADNICIDGVAGSCSCSGATAVFTPDQPLAQNTTYTVNITTGITDEAGNAMAQAWSSTFKTEIVTAPTADAGPNQLAAEGTEVTLDGSGSAAASGGNLSWTWTQVSGPDVGMLAASDNPTFTAPTGVTSLLFSLVVTEDGIDSEADEVSIVVVSDPDDLCFVSTTGDDGASGAYGTPVATIARAIEIVEADDAGGDILIAAGDYPNGFSLKTQLRFYGGFDPGTWQRDPVLHQTRIQAQLVGSDAHGLVLDGLHLQHKGTANEWHATGLNIVDSDDVVLRNCVIIGPDADVGHGASAVALRLCACDQLVIEDCDLQAGDGAVGITGASGNSGVPGLTGYNGSGGGEPGSGGDGGGGLATDPEGQGECDGGRGGNADWGAHDNGSPGKCENGGAGGTTTGYAGYPGADGGPGAPGATGAGHFDADGTGAFGGVTSHWYDPSQAQGGLGHFGINGGGGGGGASGNNSFLDDGGGGGGGGGGGQGGWGGFGGHGGGASIGLLLSDCTNPLLARLRIRTGNGGTGGIGGSGGSGATGGPGGSGGDNKASDGGRGGVGGKGGDGGAGGGGGGGPVIGVLFNLCNYTMANLDYGTPELGSPGVGGDNPALENDEGDEGLIADFKVLAQK